jgi:hypothetical protein
MIAVALVALSALAVATFPRSVLVFLLFQGSLLFVFKARIPEWLRWALLATGLLVLMPVIGYFNSYYLEVATQVGIFVALALGLNIVVGLAGLLDLGYVAFFAVGAYSWAIFGSPHANIIFGGEGFPLAGWWFYIFLFVGLGTAALTGILLGLPVLRLHGDYLAIVTLGFGEVIRVLANNLDKPINLTNGPKGITPISRPPTPFGASVRRVLLFPGAADRRRGDHRQPAARRFPHRAGRGRRSEKTSWRPSDGRAARAHEADGVRLWRLVRRRDGRPVLGQAGLHQPGVVHVPRVDRRPAMVISAGWARSPARSSAPRS